MLWDKPPKTPDEIAREDLARVSQTPYVYTADGTSIMAPTRIPRS